MHRIAVFHILPADIVIHCLTVGVKTVFKRSQLKGFPLRQEIKFDVELARLFGIVGDSAEPPFVAVPFGYNGVLTCFGCQSACLVPGYGRREDEIAAVGILIERGAVFQCSVWSR